MKRFWDYFWLTIGSMLVASGIELILAPNGLVDGGVTALAILTNSLNPDIPIWLTFVVLNISILLFTAKSMGRQFFIRTIYSNIITAIGLFLLNPVERITTSEVLIVLYGGLIIGLGIGIVLKFGGGIDGTEMLAIWFKKHFHIPVSAFLLSINGIILALSAFVNSIEKAMFSIAIFYLISKVIDFISHGLNQAKSVMIISQETEIIGKQLIRELDAKITYLYGEGGYSGEKRRIIYCIVDRFLYSRLKGIVLEIDQSAILEASDVTETKGVQRSNLLLSLRKFYKSRSVIRQ